MSHMRGGFCGAPGNVAFYPPPFPCYHNAWEDQFQHIQHQPIISPPPVIQVKTDWDETSESHILKVELKGFNKDDVKVEIQEGKVLCISGEKKIEKEEKTDTGRRVERSTAKFTRRFQLPQNAKVDAMNAYMENEVITLTIPKKDKVKKHHARVVEITSK